MCVLSSTWITQCGCCPYFALRASGFEVYKSHCGVTGLISTCFHISLENVPKETSLASNSNTVVGKERDFSMDIFVSSLRN
jgi:hypothetical protein